MNERVLDKYKPKSFLYTVRSTSKNIPKTISVYADNEEEAYETVLATIKNLAKDEVLDPIVLNLYSTTTKVEPIEIVEELPVEPESEEDLETTEEDLETTE